MTAEETGKFRTGDPCQRCGISVFPTEVDCLLLLRILPAAVTQKWTHIASGVLTPEHGWAKVTPGRIPTHHTWWPAAEVIDRCKLFSDVKPAVQQ